MSSSIRISVFLLTLACCLVLAACGSGAAGTAGVVSFDLQPVSRVIAVGQTQKYTVLATREDGSVVDILAHECHWELLPGADLSLILDNPGELRGISAGFARIRVICNGISRDFQFSVF